MQWRGKQRPFVPPPQFLVPQHGSVMPHSLRKEMRNRDEAEEEEGEEDEEGHEEKGNL